MPAWDVNGFRIPFGGLAMKIRGSVAEMGKLSKALFWTAMGHTFPNCGASMDLGRLRAPLALPLMEVKSTESGKVDVLHIEAGEKMVKLFFWCMGVAPRRA